jgi:hypothetical protein
MTSFKSRIFNFVMRERHLLRGKSEREVFDFNTSIIVGENDARLPLISPLFGDLKGLPPIFINSGVDDELYCVT